MLKGIADLNLVGWYLEWAKSAATEFRRDISASAKLEAAGKLTEPLNDMFNRLSPEKQEEILPILNNRSKYLSEMHSISQTRLDAVLKSPPSKNPVIAKVLSSSKSSQPPSRDPSPPSDSIVTGVATSADCGPGEYLARWQDLLENMPLTSLTLDGGATVANLPNDKVKTRGSMDVKPVTKQLGPEFRRLLASKGLYW